MKTIFLACSILFLVNLAQSQSFTLHQLNSNNPFSYENDVVQILTNGDSVICANRGDSVISIFYNNTWDYKKRSIYNFYQSGSSIKELAMEPNGNLWIANFSTIDVFDFVNPVTNMTSSNSELQNDFVVGITIDENNKKVVGYNNGFGVSIEDNGVWTHKGSFTGAFTELNSIFTPKIVALNPLNNDVWLVYSSNLYRIESNGVTKYDVSQTSLNASTVSSIEGMTVTEDGVVWFSSNSSSNGGLISFDGTSWNYYNMSNNSNVPSNTISAIGSYGNELVLHDYSIGGIYLFTPTSSTYYNYSNSNFPSNITYIREIKTINNIIYMATDAGLLEFDLLASVPTAEKNKTISFYPNPTSNIITFNNISELNNSLIEIRDINGKIIYSSVLKQMIDVSLLNQGTYIIKITNNGTVISSDVFIKQ